MPVVKDVIDRALLSAMFTAPILDRNRKTNYMIDNFELIKPLFYFNEANNMFFHLQILRRGKDHPDLPAANKLIRSWLVRSREHLETIREEVIFLCEHYKARAYINVAGKDFDKLNALILKKLADNAYIGNVINPWHVYNSACGELHSRRKSWIIDIDTRDLDTKYEASLQELTEFGVAFIINAAKLTGFPSSGAETLINEVDYQLRIGLLSIKNENENYQRCS